MKIFNIFKPSEENNKDVADNKDVLENVVENSLPEIAEPEEVEKISYYEKEVGRKKVKSWNKRKLE